ncbi:MAG: MmgE/PrpD family protein [Clostridiales bacterium]|nr:MmgE/PrpD family protein [Clostridiales bacterium]
MVSEQLLASFIHDTKYSDLDEITVKTVKLQLSATWGALIAGSATAVSAAVDFVEDMGGKPEATVFVRGAKLPSHQAAFANAAMGRALDIDDHISPGPHFGCAVIPAAFAAAEYVGGCSGEEFITAIAVGTEVSLRLKLEEAHYSGFDPTGVTAVFGCAAAASKLMGLDAGQIWNALGLVSDRSGASFQHFIDGVLGGPIMQGWIAQAGVECARLAKCGITGTINYLEGIYGYFHLFGRDDADIAPVTKELGKEWHLKNLNFKKYPSCGNTQGSTELILRMMKEHGFGGDDVENVEIVLPPYAFKLVGGPFKIGANPRVDAQFCVAYCVTDALLRSPVTLSHFDAEMVKDPMIYDFIKEKVTVRMDPAVDRTHYASDINVWTKDGRQYHGQIDIPPGTPAFPMTAEEHHARFYDCAKYSGKQWIEGREEDILDFIGTFEMKDDVREIVPLFLP